ncbi:MAG: mercury methylation corrinoid protein HgcA [Anaerosomatales bacterium]
MSECCGPSPSCCGGAAEEYPYSEAPYLSGSVSTLFGEVPAVATALTRADRLGTLRVRLGLRRGHYRIRPGLYAIGKPDDTTPVLVTANYKLSFDAVRSELAGRDAWLLVLDTQGVNVWCAAGKGTFGTDEVVRQIRETGLANVVGHFTVVLPQLGAPGVAAHEVRAATGFRVVYGPVRAADLPAFLNSQMHATPEMRRVRFGLADRLTVTGTELAIVRDPRVLAGAAALLLAATLGWLSFPTVLLALTAGLAGLLAGALLVPIALPWIPGRAFSLKGALAGTVAGLALLATAGRTIDTAGSIALVLGVATISSFSAMNYTGASTYTSLSGVLWEMRRAVPLQLIATVTALVALVVSALW